MRLLGLRWFGLPRITPGCAEQPSQPSGKSLSATPSLDFVYEEMKRRVDAQDVQFVALDGKASFALTAASILAAGLGLSDSSVFETRLTRIDSLEAAVVGLAVLLFLSLVGCVVKAHHLRRLQHVPVPRELMTYVPRDPQETKEHLADAMMHALEFNEAVAKNKARWVIAAEVLLLIEAAWLATVVVGRMIR